MEKFQACLVVEALGIVTVIGILGTQETYRQRGIDKIPDKHKEILIENGLLFRYYYKYPEFPSNYTLYIEDKSIQGNVTMTYPYKKYLKRLNISCG